MHIAGFTRSLRPGVEVHGAHHRALSQRPVKLCAEGPHSALREAASLEESSSQPAEGRSVQARIYEAQSQWRGSDSRPRRPGCDRIQCHSRIYRSEEHTSELQSLMRISYAVFCLKKKKTTRITHIIEQI